MSQPVYYTHGGMTPTPYAPLTRRATLPRLPPTPFRSPARDHACCLPARPGPGSCRGPSAPAVVLLSPLAFALVFASWTIFAVLGVELKGVLGFGEARFAVLLAMPMAVGGLASLPMAALARRVGGRRVMIACLLLICPFLWGLSHAKIGRASCRERVSSSAVEGSVEGRGG